MAADGSVIIDVKMNTSQADKDLAKLKKEIQKTEDTIGEQEAKKSPLTQEAERLSAQMKVARAEVKKFGDQWVAGVAGADGQQARASERLTQIESQYAKVVADIDKIDKKLLPAYEKLDRMKEEAGGLQQNINQAANSTRKMEKATKRANKHMGIFATRLRGILLSAFVFNIMSRGFRELTDWMGNVIKSNDEARASIAKLKGALLTLAQPLVEFVIPAFITLINVLTRVVSTLAQIFAMLTGGSVDASKKAAEALNEQTQALEGTGAAADDASKSLAGFDEINKLSGGSKGSESETIAADFSFEADLPEDNLKNILGLIEAIGTAFLSWKIGSALGLGLSGILGLAMAIYSAVQFVKAIFDAWTNGVNTENVQQMLLSLVGLAVGLGIAFGPVAAGIALIVGGLAMLVTGFRDAMQNGWNFQNTLLSIAGILATGAGIALLTGSWIPLLIAGIASALLALTVAMGHGDELIGGLKMAFQGLVDFVKGIFTGDMEMALGGISTLFDGLGMALDAVIMSIRDLILSFFDWLDEKTGGKLTPLIEAMKALFTDMFSSISAGMRGLMEGMKQILTGIIQFITGVFTGDWDRAWEGVKNIFKGIWNGVVSLFENAINFIIRGFNGLINKLNSFRIEIPPIPIIGFGGYSFGLSIPTFSELAIPRLAEGAVIPPNREFLAVLGDQKSGTNIETPMSTMIEAFKKAAAESGLGNGTITVVVNLDGKEVARNQVKHINDMTRQAGKPVLLF